MGYWGNRSECLSVWQKSILCWAKRRKRVKGVKKNVWHVRRRESLGNAGWEKLCSIYLKIQALGWTSLCVPQLSAACLLQRKARVKAGTDTLQKAYGLLATRPFHFLAHKHCADSSGLKLKWAGRLGKLEEGKFTSFLQPSGLLGHQNPLLASCLYWHEETVTSSFH